MFYSKSIILFSSGILHYEKKIINNFNVEFKLKIIILLIGLIQ